MGSDLHDVFIQEAMNHIVKINAGLLSCEKEGIGPEQVKILKSEIHTLKGDSRMLGFQSISQAAHKMEDLILLFDSSTESTCQLILKTLFAILDAVEAAVKALPGKKVEIDLAAFEIPQQGAPVVSESKKEPEPEPEPDSTPRSHGLESGKIAEYINISLDKIVSLVKVSSVFPRYSSRFNFIMNKLHDIERQLSQKLPGDMYCKQFEDLINEFSHELAFFELSSRQFQDEVTKLKLVPLSTIFKFFPRLVRDIAESTGKKVNLTIAGNEVELDKFIVENFKNILIHILRNAVDHGIETPAKRQEAGKQPTGRIHLSAVNKGDNVIIEVSDDGQGLDLEKIRAKALEKGLLTPAEAELCDESKLTSLIFSSGFTTKQIGAFSGRGVGMDVVASTLKEIGGDISIRNVRKKGTTFSVTLPLVSSYIPVTIFALGKSLYGIPSSYIELVTLSKTVQLKTDAAHNDQFFISLNNNEITLIDLQDVFALGKNTQTENLKLIICRHQEEVTGFIVTDIILEKKLVISRPTALVDKLDVILGGVLLGMERVIPVLNIPQLFSYLKDNAKSLSRIAKTEQERHEIGFKNILLVEDSLVTRTSEKKLLIRENFNVLEAANGKEALDLLKKNRVDCILTDIEMPVMNGIELITKLKTELNYKAIPIIVISSYQNYSEKLGGLNVPHFINKAEFSRERLLTALKQLHVL